MDRYKHPRTPHLPWSESSSSDDIYMDTPTFSGKHITITEKIDGECTSIYSDGFVHARSVEGNYHPSRDWIRAKAAEISWQLPDGWRIVGENMYAKHSIHYTCLESLFYVFAVFDENNICISWEDTEKLCSRLNLETVWPIESHPWRDKDRQEDWDLLWSALHQTCHDPEGYVIRNSDSFHYNDWSKNVAKFVRKNHVQTDKNWKTQAVIRNELRNER